MLIINRGTARATRAKARIETLLLWLNVVAFLGYATLPATYFAPEYEHQHDTHDTAASLKSQFADALHAVGLSWPGHDFVSWWGNLAGDIAWSIEPAVMLMTPLLLMGLQPPKQQHSNSKLKAA